MRSYKIALINNKIKIAYSEKLASFFF